MRWDAPPPSRLPLWKRRARSMRTVVLAPLVLGCFVLLMFTRHGEPAQPRSPCLCCLAAPSWRSSRPTVPTSTRALAYRNRMHFVPAILLTGAVAFNGYRSAAWQLRSVDHLRTARHALAPHVSSFVSLTDRLPP